MEMLPPRSCDTFVILPPYTKTGDVIFGKNADRPQNEVQEVVFVKGGFRPFPRVACTYITIDQTAAAVNDVILSKPAWMWGAEMGANSKNVAIGNEAVWTNNMHGDGDASIKRLLGMDLVRRCQKVVHSTTVCSGLSTKQLAALKAADNLEWTCNDCNLNSSRRKSYVPLADYDEEDEEEVNVAQANLDVKKLLQELRKEVATIVTQEMRSVSSSVQFCSQKCCVPTK